MKIPFVFLLFPFLLIGASNSSSEDTTKKYIPSVNQDSWKSTNWSDIPKDKQNELLSYNDQLDLILTKNFENYTNFKMRPYFYGPPVSVIARVELREILDISEVDMQIKLHLVMQIYWDDPRLKFEHVPAFNSSFSGVWLGGDDEGKIWIPDVSILNEKESVTHSAGFVPKTLEWFPECSLLLRINVATTVSCSMSLQDFPMDEQNCSVLIGSPNYRDSEVQLNVTPYLHPVFSNSVQNAELLGVRVSTLIHKSKHFNRTVFSCELLLRRYVGYYIIGTFFPSGLVVVISWLTFWMARDAAGERMALGVTCVLTITTLLISSQASAPKVSYIKAIDIYMGVCFSLVFSVLLQSTTVGYLLRKVQIQEAVRRITEAGNGSGPKQASRDFVSVVRRVISGDLEANEKPKVIKFILRCDIWCRVIFPMIFLMFNVAFWTYYLTGSEFDDKKGWRKPEKYDTLLDARVNSTEGFAVPV